MKELWDTRSLEVGWEPVHLMNAWKSKEKYLRSKGMIEKYNEELDAVDSEAPSQDDIAKFALTQSTNGIAFWGQFRTHPYWKAVDKQVSDEVRDKMLAEHPDYKLLLDAYAAGGWKKVYNLQGPWMTAGYDNGLHGHFEGWVPRVMHHH
mmetsp:Transcript_99828/g.172091  ORF Transcript_99828/g.172091 Transcript_99828/m.172091 type:complete len:149 (-) Transcript_99828:174-620(-)